MKKISILFLILLCNCTFLYAQQFSITGVVTDKKLNEPIIGASVVVKGTTNGTVTDLDGKFTIQASKSSVLIISFIGYTPQEFTINGNLPWIKKHWNHVLSLQFHKLFKE